MRLETKYLAIFGLSLTFLMAAVLFVLVGMKPKLESYSLLPWLYATFCTLASTACWIWAKKLERQISPQPAKILAENQTSENSSVISR